MTVEEKLEKLGFYEVNAYAWIRNGDNFDSWDLFKDFIGTPYEWTLQHDVPDKKVEEWDFETFDDLVEFWQKALDK